MEPEGSLPCSQEPAAGPCLEPYESVNTLPPYFPNISYSIILPSTPGSSK
jgi:hypothetical protein